ncbi:MAG: hypothetical protein R3C20_08970 [Planctomycetaceae bacterium]
MPQFVLPILNACRRRVSCRPVVVCLAMITWSTAQAQTNRAGTQENTSAPGGVFHEATRTDLFISGIYPHLTTYGVYSENGGHFKPGHNECGIGGIVPWAGKLWMVNYAPHMPRGSEHKLFSVDPDLSKPMTIHPESVGGTPAGRMIHEESQQLLIAHYLIDAQGHVRTISPADMPIRVTAIARHLTDPANMVYYIDMEGSIWEANVQTLAVQRLFKKPVPGWHGKGGYTSQGRLVISNNGELHVGDYKDVLVGGKATNAEERGVLAEFNGTNWKIIERRQFTEVTGPKGITGGSDGNDPLWTMGWDRRSVRLKVLDNGQWHTYLLPKAAYCNDASHGWYTEWPRIREITDGRWMMDMHGMFYNFPPTFSAQNSAGITPIGSHLRYVPDFCNWNGRLVLATDETSIQENKLAGQPQSNLWFGRFEDLKTWGPASGYGGPWVEDDVKAGVPSDPFLVAGFQRRVLHLATGRRSPLVPADMLRATDQQQIHRLSDELATLPRVTVDRGDWHQAAHGFSFEIDQPVTVYLAVDRRGSPKLNPEWKLTELSLTWGAKHETDVVYSQSFPKGTVHIPGNPTEHSRNAFGMPHMAFVKGTLPTVDITPSKGATVTRPQTVSTKTDATVPVAFTVQIDHAGNGLWTDFKTIAVENDGYVAELLPADLDAVWLRIVADRDCTATAQLHQTSDYPAAKSLSSDADLFAGLADAASTDSHSAVIYAAKRNRNLRVITDKGKFFEFTKAGFEFKVDESDAKLAELIRTETEFAVDDASVILMHKGVRRRLPKGGSAFDRPFAVAGSITGAWPRATREVESERHLANIHGTFYEVPLVINGQPPAFDQMRPVASHNKRIMDYCTWNGLLVLAGVSKSATANPHIFASSDDKTALWFGGIDDLWKLGKPVGIGGPWKNSAVIAGEPSDPYLMTGYDHKQLTLTASTDTTITIEVDIDHQSGWHTYRTVSLIADETFTFIFPPEFSAHWVRFVSSKSCTATATLEYK